MTVLFVDDEEHLRIAAAQSFDLADIKADCFAEAERALERLDDTFDGVVVTDIRMPGMDGVALLAAVHQIDADIPIVLLTGHGDVELAVRCIKDGAYDFLEKPCEPARLVATVQRALELRKLTLENRSLRRQVASSNVIDARLSGLSDAMVAVRQKATAIATSAADVLIHGATGTGKEVAARAIHASSNRASKPFVHINCAALPDTLVESELFGSEVGAFPGAMRTRVGKFEHARGGVLCLDEIDSLPVQLQAKLLDVLQNRQITRLGSNDPIPLDIRVFALAKTDLQDAVRSGDFREDLLYRLNVVTLPMPSLADRREDVPSLFTQLLKEAAQRCGLETPDAPAELLSSLASREWPGNVRELGNVAERFAMGLAEPDGVESQQTLAEQLAAFEKALIAASIGANEGSLKRTYESLGLSRKTLYDKMVKHGLNKQSVLTDKDV